MDLGKYNGCEKILRMDNHELERPTPRIADGAQALYAFVYGK